VVGPSAPETFPTPTIVPLGDSGLLVRFGTVLTDAANRAAIALAMALDRTPIAGVTEIVPNLVSVLLRYQPGVGSSAATIAGELRLLLSGLAEEAPQTTHWTIPVMFDGPDLDTVSAALGLGEAQFVARHNAGPLRVLATGFAAGSTPMRWCCRGGPRCGRPSRRAACSLRQGRQRSPRPRCRPGGTSSAAPTSPISIRRGIRRRA
jgi:hypothetical protein